ncbi:MarR family winged helix-turn-helix transcriptional regulator [Streptomyces sp. NPDC056165]|uniref:MarR family winged helix-turn-helix transcriptional regulator n=1 Tax=Streptomyces sp. NPDC056165 TaxID=3345733 RepID=UPI0035E1204C
MTPDRDAKAATTTRADVERTAEMIHVFLELGNAAGAVVADALAEFEVTASVAGVLGMLQPGDAPLTMREIAARLHCDPSTVSLTADKLEGMGLATRRPHPDDGRKRTLVLTERGHELWQALSARLHTSGLFTGLDTHEQIALHALLTKIRLPQRP